MPSQAAVRAPEPDLVGRLAKFFPEAMPVRIPIKLSRAAASGDGDGNGNGNEGHAIFLQNTLIEFGTPREILFVVDHPLEFADRVLIENNDGSLHIEASVVAVQYHPQRTVIAARFLKDVPNWIVKP